MGLDERPKSAWEGSPKILQLSGIGDAKELNDLGIEVANNLPGVGKNLQDHLRMEPTRNSYPALSNLTT